MSAIPTIQILNGIPTLYVHGEPFLVLGGEVHNSAASSLEFMEKSVWPNLKDLNLNTVLVPIYWEMLEAQEGRYCFDLPDRLIAQARQNGMHLIFLWFGLWKNGMSTYVPGWMKQQPERYFRSRKPGGEPINAISPLCEAAVQKDAAAFRALMAHIRDTDAAQSTVIAIQVENEIGLLGAARDYGPQANALFAGNVPEALTAGGSGTWTQVYGEDAAEMFMAYHYACAVETIAQAGRAEYPLPCFVNTWLRQHPWYAGSYPSGGPIRSVHAIWKAAAPSLFALAPDIYVPYTADVMDEFSYAGNPLVIPEIRKDAVTASYCLYAFGRHQAICYSPFGIEDLARSPKALDNPSAEVLTALNIDASALNTAGSGAYLRRVYGLMAQMKPLYLQYRGTEQLKSYIKRSDTDLGTFLRFSKYDVQIDYQPQEPGKPLSAGMIYELAPDKFLLVGMRSSIRFRPKEEETAQVDYLRLEEGEIVNGQWQPGRLLNGDEQMHLRLPDTAACYLAQLYLY